VTAVSLTPAQIRATYRLPEEDEALLAECDVVPFKSSGPGGQHKNKTLSSVRLYHRPTGLVVIGRRERSFLRNLKDALGRLREKLERLLVEPKVRRPTKPSRRAVEARLREKKARGRRKEDRAHRDSE
jgi:protein subunit release factor B